MIVNTDQSSQFTAEEITGVVLAKGCKLSMDERGAWRDNVFVERLWRSVKYERGVPQGLRQRGRGTHRHCRLHGLVQRVARIQVRTNSRRMKSIWRPLHPRRRPRKMKFLVCPELPTAALRSSQATHAAVDNSEPFATHPQSTYKSGKVV